MYIYIFQHREKSGIEYHFILYLIWLVHFSTNTLTLTYTHTRLRTLSSTRKSRKHSEDDDIGIMWLNRSCIVVVQTEPWLGIIIVGGYYRRVKKPPQLTVFENKMARHNGTCHPFFFFQVQKQNKKYVDSQVWLKYCEWQVLIGWFGGSAPLPSHILSFFFFSNFLTYRHTCKICGR